MNTGIDYLTSSEKEDFDRWIAHAIKPVATLATLGARAAFGYDIYADVRIGRDGDKFDAKKIITLDDNGDPINKCAELFRKFGLDETPQIARIFDGELSIVGRRQLIPEEYETMRVVARRTNNGRSQLAEWDELVLPYKCGLLSSFALEGHQVGQENIERRLELDIQDSADACRPHDWTLIRQALSAAANNRLQYGSLPIKE